MLMEKGREVMDRGAEHGGWRRRDRGKKVRGREREVLLLPQIPPLSSSPAMLESFVM